MEHTFSKDDTNTVKGIAILIIVCHHIFWDALFVQDGSMNQIFLLSGVTRFFTRWGFCCNHVFAAITGYGIAESIKRNKKPFDILRRREVTLLGTFIPVYLITSMVFILTCGGFSSFYMVYNQGTHWKTLLNIALDMFGLSDAFHFKLLNPTWWYFSAAQVFSIGIIILCCLFRRRFAKTGFLFVWIGLFIFMVFKPILYGCLMLATLSGFIISKYNLLEKLSGLLKRVSARKELSLIAEVAIIFASLLVWYLLVKKFDPHFISAVTLPIPFMLSARIIEFVPPLRKGLGFFGKHSASIFMLHTFFFLVYPFSRSFVYSFRYAATTYLLVIGSSILAGVLIDKIEQITGYKKMINHLKEI